MQFCELVAAVRNTPLDVTIPADWGQGRASFGGLLVALQYEAMRAHVPVERALRSLAVSSSRRWAISSARIVSRRSGRSGRLR